LFAVILSYLLSATCDVTLKRGCKHT